MSNPVTVDVAKEINALDPIPHTLFLKSGLAVRIEELRLRQFLRLIRIITRGVLPIMDFSEFKLDADSAGEVFSARLGFLLLMGIPEAENETIDFLKSMLSPADLIEKPVLQKSDAETNKKLWARLDKEITNPHLEDTVDIVDAIIKSEAADIQALIKKVTTMYKAAKRMGKVPEAVDQIFQGQSSSEESPELSTPSSQNTDGQTSESKEQELRDYVNTLP